jgi:hypothetical protein
MWRRQIVWVALYTPQGIVEMALANGVKSELRKLPQTLIKPPQLQFQALHGEMLYPVAEKFFGHSVVSAGARYSALGVQTLVKNSSLPKGMNRLGEKGLEHENGYLSATGNDGDPAAGRTFENDV